MTERERAFKLAQAIPVFGAVQELIISERRAAKIEALEWAIEQACPGIEMTEVLAEEIARLKGSA